MTAETRATSSLVAGTRSIDAHYRQTGTRCVWSWKSLALMLLSARPSEMCWVRGGFFHVDMKLPLGVVGGGE